MTSPGERRTTLARPDLADLRLQGIVRAGRFVSPRPLVCTAAWASIRRAPDPGAEQDDQLLHGERFDVLEEADGWAWGQARRDGYVGYVRAARLGPVEGPPTHRVAALRTYAFAGPGKKSAFLGPYSLNALVRARAPRRDGFVDCGPSGWIFEAHLKPIGDFEPEPAAVAEWHLRTPYLWGGRDSRGLDCSGLVQQAMFACGRACPRDADLQLGFFGRAAPQAGLRRGDLVFWPDHVAMMLDGTRLIHASGGHMAVTVEPLAEAVGRIGAEPLALRRP